MTPWTCFAASGTFLGGLRSSRSQSQWRKQRLCSQMLDCISKQSSAASSSRRLRPLPQGATVKGGLKGGGGWGFISFCLIAPPNV